jgi:hypothetical protein
MSMAQSQGAAALLVGTMTPRPPEPPVPEDVETVLNHLRRDLANALFVVDVTLRFPESWERQRTQLHLLLPTLTRIVEHVAKLTS